MKKPVGLFRYTLLRTVAALLVFEILVGTLAYAVLMSPVLNKLAQSFSWQVVQNMPLQTSGFMFLQSAPEDGGTSLLPFNYLLAKHIAQITGQSSSVHCVKNSASQYWIKLADNRYVTFDYQTVVGAQPIQTLLAWIALALLVALIIAGMLARGISQKVGQLRDSLQQPARSRNQDGIESLGITELDELRAEFLSLMEKIELALDDRTTLLLGLTHDLSAPVARLTMAIELYAREVPSDRRIAMQADIDAMRRIIEQFLSAARCLGEPEHGSVQELSLWLLKRYEDQPRVHLKTDLADSKVSLNIMAAERILVNLIDNALRHTQGASVQVEASLENETLTLAVSDDGPGLGEAELLRVIRPFQRISGSQGIGLGLALVRLLAEQNGWLFALNNRQTQGIEASIKIPLPI